MLAVGGVSSSLVGRKVKPDSLPPLVVLTEEKFRLRHACRIGLPSGRSNVAKPAITVAIAAIPPPIPAGKVGQQVGDALTRLWSPRRLHRKVCSCDAREGMGVEEERTMKKADVPAACECLSAGALF